MTLDIVRFLNDAFKKQAKISHFNFKISIGKPKTLSSKWKQQIINQFGELFLNDANYILITSAEGNINDLKIKLADVVSNVFLTTIRKTDIKAIENQKVTEEDDIENINNFEDNFQ